MDTKHYNMIIFSLTKQIIFFQLKVTAIDDELKVISEFKMSFDEDLSEFGERRGMPEPTKQVTEAELTG
uniref:Uncharacterized protein n=1 Tax=Callorhinchus milii TaxID=7868 RepID=A0A4W3HC08_CALMI